MDNQFHHRATTNFKQVNKGHKTGKHDTKGVIKQRNKGKVESSRSGVKELTKTDTKSDRKNKGKQNISRQREEQLLNKRAGKDKTPRNVALISLGCNEHAFVNVFKLLIEQTDLNGFSDIFGIPYTANFPQWKQRVTLFATPRDYNAVLDIAKVADLVVFIVGTDGADKLGEFFVSLIKGQGLPYVIGVLNGLETLTPKQAKDTKRDITKYFETSFSDDMRFLSVDNAQEAAQLARFISTSGLREIHWRDNRPYMLADKLTFTPNENDPQVGSLKVSGFLRGANLNVNYLVHVTDLGDFQLKQVERPTDPYLPAHRKKNDSMEGDHPEVLAVADPNVQESLQTENLPGTWTSEQTWPTEEELQDAEKEEKEKRKKRLVPKGTSSYQAAWIVESDEENGNEDDEEEMEPDEEEDMRDEEEQSENKQSDAEAKHQSDEEADMEEMEELEDIDEESRKDMEKMKEEMEDAKRRKQEQEDLEFPDEVDTPFDIPARIRFQKYRGLKSLRTSPWDPKESLPAEYAKIFQFENFNKAKKRIMMNKDATVDADQYVTLELLNVPQNLLASRKAGHPFVLSGLLKYENKVSVLHFKLLKHPTFNDAFKSKDLVTMNVGFRRYQANPVLSENNSNCDKHKYERFLHQSRGTMASIYGPITFPPVPLVMLRIDDGQTKFVATGSLHSVDPDRIILKKIVLSGHPFKIYKKHAVVRKMFFNSQDVEWFKPVEVSTKYGRTGHILEPVGTHGYMKVQFDDRLMQHDTILMNLYKRVYPPWGTKSNDNETKLQSQMKE